MSDQGSAAEELRTARLSLRRPTEADIDAIFEIHNDPRTCLHNPSDALARFEEAEELYQGWNDQWQRCGYGYWVVRRHGSGQQLGFCGIKPMDLHGRRVLNLFYRFATSAWTEVLLVLEGRLELSVQGAEVTVGPGEMYVVAAGARHAVRTGSHGTLVIVEGPRGARALRRRAAIGRRSSRLSCHCTSRTARSSIAAPDDSNNGAAEERRGSPR
ncbi:GNAT family N-acetyltransferase [Streptomyces sp. NPDC002867]